MMPAWRLRCPEGHCSLEMYRRPFRCKVCEKTYTVGHK